MLNDQQIMSTVHKLSLSYQRYDEYKKLLNKDLATVENLMKDPTEHLKEGVTVAEAMVILEDTKKAILAKITSIDQAKADLKQKCQESGFGVLDMTAEIMRDFLPYF